MVVARFATICRVLCDSIVRSDMYDLATAAAALTMCAGFRFDGLQIGWQSTYQGLLRILVRD